jgi:DNA end-binding protein Ku
MRSVWSGTVSFAPVAVPVRIFTATDSKDPRLHVLHRRDRAGRPRRVRKDTGEHVDSAREAKGRYRTVSKRKTPRTPTSMAALRQSVERTQLTRTLSRAKAS